MCIDGRRYVYCSECNDLGMSLDSTCVVYVVMWLSLVCQ